MCSGAAGPRAPAGRRIVRAPDARLLCKHSFCWLGFRGNWNPRPLSWISVIEHGAVTLPSLRSPQLSSAP